MNECADRRFDCVVRCGKDANCCAHHILAAVIGVSDSGMARVGSMDAGWLDGWKLETGVGK